MGLFRKIKDIFYDEEIVEVPDKEEEEKEERQEVRSRQEPPVIEEITAPVKTVNFDSDEEEEEETDKFNERELFKPEKTFDFPVFDEEEEEVKTRSKTNVLELQKELEQRSMNTRERVYERKETPSEEVNNNSSSTFRPSPVISPVYGILDKNYTKEEIVEKKDVEKPYKGDINYDYVRRKAYGTLEDELEDTLTKVNTNIVDEVDELEKEIDELPKPTKNIEDLLGQIERNATIGELEEKAKNEMINEEEEQEEVKPEVDDNTLEHDLFNLIDSMYEDKEE